MKENNKNIEQLFKETFESYEADVNPDLWNNIQAKVNTAPAPASTGAWSSLKIAATVLVSAAIITTGVLVINYTKENKLSNNLNKTEQIKVEVNPAENKVTEVQPISSNILVHKEIPTESNNKKTSKQIDDRSSTAKTAIDKDQYKGFYPSGRDFTGNSDKYINPINTKEEKEISNNTDVGPSVISEQSNNSKKEAPAVTSSNQRLAVISVNQKSGCSPLTVKFNNLGTASSVKWNFGETLPTTNESNPEIILNKPGKYSIVLSAADTRGRTETDSLTVEVFGIDKTLIPNIFTPNGDGFNDAFSFSISDITSLEAIIFDRSGNKIYSWNRAEGFWDGRLANGSLAPVGTYFYRANVVANNYTCSYQGFITLER